MAFFICYCCRYEYKAKCFNAACSVLWGYLYVYDFRVDHLVLGPQLGSSSQGKIIPPIVRFLTHPYFFVYVWGPMGFSPSIFTCMLVSYIFRFCLGVHVGETLRETSPSFVKDTISQQFPDPLTLRSFPLCLPQCPLALRVCFRHSTGTGYRVFSCSLNLF